MHASWHEFSKIHPIEIMVLSLNLAFSPNPCQPEISKILLATKKDSDSSVFLMRTQEVNLSLFLSVCTKIRRGCQEFVFSPIMNWMVCATPTSHHKLNFLSSLEFSSKITVFAWLLFRSFAAKACKEIFNHSFVSFHVLCALWRCISCNFCNLIVSSESLENFPWGN
jgi:hypothetical protein